MYLIPQKKQGRAETCLFTSNLVLTGVMFHTVEDKRGVYCLDLMAELCYRVVSEGRACIIFRMQNSQQRVAEV